jgi:hypothetical protein
MLVAGDSLAVGVAPHVHRARVDAAVGRGSAEGVRRIRNHGDRVLIVSLGVNDPPSAGQSFRQRVRLVLEGRECVAWITIPSRPELTAVLRTEANRDRRLRLVSMTGIALADGVHPTSYRTLAGRAVRACV